jgi:hypothetical protein
MAQLLGADWVNLSVIEDFSTQTFKFEIHLEINLKNKATTDDIRDELERASGARKGITGDIDAKTLKRKLRALAKADATSPPGSDAEFRRSRRQIINAIMVKQVGRKRVTAAKRGTRAKRRATR